MREYMNARLAAWKVLHSEAISCRMQPAAQISVFALYALPWSDRHRCSLPRLESSHSDAVTSPRAGCSQPPRCPLYASPCADYHKPHCETDDGLDMTQQRKLVHKGVRLPPLVCRLSCPAGVHGC